MQVSAYGFKRMKGHKRGCRCAIHAGGRRGRQRKVYLSRRRKHKARRGHRGGRRSIGAASRKASKICRRRTGRAHASRGCMRKELRKILGGRRSRR